MSTTSCIAHPAQMRVACLREDYLTICDGHHCAAMLLGFFEYWHNRKLDSQAQATHQNRVAEAHGEAPTQDTSLWHYHTETQLRQALLGLYGEKKIREEIHFLEEDKGFIQTGSNPNPKYKYDQTTFFLFLQPQVQAVLNAAYPPAAVHPAKSPDESDERTGPSGEKAGTRSEISSKISSEEEEEARPPTPDDQETPAPVPHPPAADPAFTTTPDVLEAFQIWEAETHLDIPRVATVQMHAFVHTQGLEYTRAWIRYNRHVRYMNKDGPWSPGWALLGNVYHLFSPKIVVGNQAGFHKWRQEVRQQQQDEAQGCPHRQVADFGDQTGYCVRCQVPMHQRDGVWHEVPPPQEEVPDAV